MQRRALYVSHTGMSEPLGQSQVLPYLRGLARHGWRFDIVAFEPSTADPDEVARLARDLADEGIGYSYALRSPSHALPVKLAEAAHALGRLVARALASRPSVLHARGHLPGAVALAARALAPGARFLFDCRGLVAEEYVDAGHWRPGSLKFRLVKRVEKNLFGDADAVVTLTDRLRRWLRAETTLVRPSTPVEVIPCCVDLARFRVGDGERAEARRRLEAGDRFVLTYSGTLGSWYREDEMASLYAAVRRHRPSLLALYSRSPVDKFRAALRARGVPDEEIRVVAVKPREMPLMLAGADAAMSFIAPCFSKIASSPTKIAEYLAVGLPVAMNRGIGDSDALADELPGIVVDAGALSPDEIERTAAALVALDRSAVAARARAAAEARFSVEGVGVARYLGVYEALAAGAA